MRTDGTCGRGNRDYHGEEDVLKGRLMDEHEEYVIPDNDEEDGLAASLPPEIPEDGNDLYEDVDHPLVRWGLEIADKRYFEKR